MISLMDRASSLLEFTASQAIRIQCAEGQNTYGVTSQGHLNTVLQGQERLPERSDV